MASSQKIPGAPLSNTSQNDSFCGGTGRKSKNAPPPLYARTELSFDRVPTRPPTQPRKRKPAEPTTPAFTFSPSQPKIQSGLQDPEIRTPIMPRTVSVHESSQAYLSPESHGHLPEESKDYPAPKRLRPLTHHSEISPSAIHSIPVHTSPVHSSPSAASHPYRASTEHPYATASVSPSSSSSQYSPVDYRAADHYYPNTSTSSSSPSQYSPADFLAGAEYHYTHPSPASSSGSSQYSPADSTHSYPVPVQIYNSQQYQEDVNTENCNQYFLDSHLQYPIEQGRYSFSQGDMPSPYPLPLGPPRYSFSSETEVMALHAPVQHRMEYSPNIAQTHGNLEKY